MRITERRLRSIIRSVIKESLDQLGEEKTISIPYSKTKKDLFNKKIIDYCMRDLSQIMDYIEPPSYYHECNPHACFKDCIYSDPLNRDEISTGEREAAFEKVHKFTVTSHSHPSDEGGKSWEFKCVVEGQLCGFKVTAGGLPVYWNCETLSY